MWLKFKRAYFEAAVQFFSHYPMEISMDNVCVYIFITLVSSLISIECIQNLKGKITNLDDL